MRKFLFYSAVTATAMLSSCVNSDYDLENIDTNVRVAVNNLTVPVNIDEITLDNILDLDDGSRIQKMPNGEYAVVEEGTFESGAISIKPISITQPNITFDGKLNASNDILDKIPEKDVTYGEIKQLLASPEIGITDDTQLVHLEIDNASATLDFTANNVDKAVTSVGEIGFSKEVVMTVSLHFDGLDDIVSKFHVEDVAIKLPKGIKTSDSHYKDGLLSYDALESVNGTVTLTLPITAIDAEKAGAKLENHVFNFHNEVSASGHIDLYSRDIRDDVPVKTLKNVAENPVKYECKAGFTSDIEVSTFSGGVLYDVAKPNISPVDLSNLPSILKQSGTKIEMTNPQIYLSVVNPIDKKFNIQPTVQLTLQTDLQNVHGPFTQDFILDNPTSVFCMAPKPEGLSYTGYTNPEPLTFGNLGQILACTSNGEDQIPASISIDVAAKVEQDVVDFELKDYGKVNGKYAFYAPLSLSKDSRICYDKLWDDWGDEDLDGLTITSASVSATVTSTIPAEIADGTVAYLLGYDEKGNKTRMEGTATLPAKAQNHALVINLSGSKINRIYGLELKVRVNGDGEGLSSDQTITVKDVKATVSGYYDKEL